MATDTPNKPSKLCDSVDDVASKLASAVRVAPGACHDACVPDINRLIHTIKRLKAIVYPGFHFHDTPLESLPELIHSELAQVHARLSREIASAIARNKEALEDMGKPLRDTDHQPLADQLCRYSEKLATEFLCQLPEIQRVLNTDVQAAYSGDPACRNLDEVILCYPGLHAITVFRLANALQKLHIPFLPRMMTEWAHNETGVDIHPGATIGDHFFIDHGTGVVIGETCIIGQHVKIYQGVTLGALSFPQDESGELVRGTKRHPTIENNVVIYANATVLGGRTTVGRDSVIGSSVWLTHSVDAETTVIMEKPKLRMRNGRDNDDLAPVIDYQI
jgi:serine O-acetyltransferase